MKKLNKLVAVVLSLAVLAMMCAITAFALTPEQTTKDGRLVKELVVPEGVAVPNVTNTFTFTYDAANSSVTLPSGTVAPTIQNQVIDISAADDATLAEDDGNSVVDDIAIPNPTGFPVPGVYAYTVAEASSVFADTQPEGYDTSNKEIVKDNGTYTIRYYVKNVVVTDEQTGETHTELQITEVTVEDNDTNAKKDTTVTDPTGTEVTTTDPDTQEETTTVEENDGGFSFVNTLKATDGSEPADPDHPTPSEADKFALRLSKAVTNAAEDEDTQFPFTLTLTRAVGMDNAKETGYIYTPVYDNEGALTGYNKGAAVDFTFNENGVATVNTIKLTNGQFLGFAQLPAGTRYNASEDMNNGGDFSAYTAAYAVTTSDATATGHTSGNAATGASLATYVDYLLVDKANDKVAYTNDYNKDLDTPTGILINNLPYIALALVAIGGLVAYVVVRRRQDDEA